MNMRQGPVVQPKPHKGIASIPFPDLPKPRRKQPVPVPVVPAPAPIRDTVRMQGPTQVEDVAYEIPNVPIMDDSRTIDAGKYIVETIDPRDYGDSNATP